MASKCFFSFCSFSISEIKSEVGKQLQLQAGGGGDRFHGKLRFW